MTANRPAQPAVVAAARALADRRDVDAATLAGETVRCAGGLDLGAKRGAALREATELVGVYLAALAPPAPWRPADDAVAEALAEAHLLWRGPDGQVLADILDCGGAGKALWTARTRGVPRRLVAAGAAVCGPRFAAVRLLALSAPARSLALSPSDTAPRPLPATRWWFASPAGVDAGAEVAS